jgi:glutamyl-tRNA synthetase
MVTGTAQSPSVDAVMALLGREETMRRLNGYLSN